MAADLKLAHRFVLLVSVIALLDGWPPRADAQTPRQIAERTFPSVVVLTADHISGRATSLGSGFFVAENLIATNLHVVAGALRVRAKLIGAAAEYEVAGVVAVDPRADLCILKVGAFTAPSLPLGDDRQMGVGDTVFAVGNPRGLEGTFSEGIISGFRQDLSDRLIQITAPVSPGSSGGPVVDVRGRVIGIAVSTLRDSQNLNFAVPVTRLKSLLTRVGPVAAFPPAGRSERPSSPPDPDSRRPVVYLMHPRADRWDEPLSHGAWDILKTFDTASECRQTQSRDIESAQASIDALSERISTRRLTPEEETALREHARPGPYERVIIKKVTLDASRCIASDDPRLQIEGVPSGNGPAAFFRALATAAREQAARQRLLER